jgi:hypothetical protein
VNKNEFNIYLKLKMRLLFIQYLIIYLNIEKKEKSRIKSSGYLLFSKWNLMQTRGSFP